MKYYLIKFWGGPQDGEIWPWDGELPLELEIYSPLPESAARIDFIFPLLVEEARHLYYYRLINPGEPDGFVHYCLH